MNDATRASNADEEQIRTLSSLDWVGLVGRVERTKAQGQALLALVEHWAASAHALIEGIEAEAGIQAFPDEAFVAVSRLLGLDCLQALAEEIASSCEPNAPRP